VGEYLHVLLRESEQSLSDSECDTDEDDSATQDFVWENMQNYKEKRENFTGNVGPQGAAKHVTEIVVILNCFSIKN
jgi:cytochrome c556